MLIVELARRDAVTVADIPLGNIDITERRETTKLIPHLRALVSIAARNRIIVAYCLPIGTRSTSFVTKRAETNSARVKVNNLDRTALS